MKYLIGFLVACVLWIFALYNVEIPTYQIIDCRYSDISPEFPPAVKEECKRIILEDWIRRNERPNEKNIHEDRQNIFRT